MNYELNKYFTKLHKHIVKEQLQIETLQKQLTEHITNWCAQHNIETPSEQKNIVNMKDVRCNLENRPSKTKKQEENNFAALLGNDKDGYAGLFIKLNQQLHKWVETELDLLKEISKATNSIPNEQDNSLIQPDDIEVINNFHKRQLSNPNET